jgi:17beta-estradiol 17-dehydrogenase/3alpha(17beta)-hydroxysteroid dehydrogenase (NAD+)
MLSGRLALVTGGASGIGFQIAKALANEGATLCIVDVSKNLDSALKQLPDNNNRHLAYSCDVSNANDVKSLFDNIKQQYANVCPTVIVNSAGITRDNMFLKITEEDFDSVLKVNLKGTFLVTQAATKELILNNSKVNLDNFKSYASIINIGSIVGRLGNVGQANYSASKAAVEGLTKTVARELGKYKIRCNCIMPGFIRTPMTDKIPEKHLQKLKALIPIGRFGEPEEIARLALFLATDLSSYITGSSIDCNGGLSF